MATATDTELNPHILKHLIDIKQKPINSSVARLPLYSGDTCGGNHCNLVKKAN